MDITTVFETVISGSNPDECIRVGLKKEEKRFRMFIIAAMV